MWEDEFPAAEGVYGVEEDGADSLGSLAVAVYLQALCGFVDAYASEGWGDFLDGAVRKEC